MRSSKYDYQREISEAQQAAATAELEATKKYVRSLLPEITVSIMHQVVHDVTERLTANRQFTAEVTRDECRMRMELRVRLEYDIT